MNGPTSATRQRRRARPVPLVVAVVLAAVAVKVLTMMWWSASAGRDYRAGNAAAAVSGYGRLLPVNVVDRWIAFNDRGVARFATGDVRGAASDFADALALAPERCDVRVNLVITLEAEGDAATAAANPAEATRLYQAARAASAGGSCTGGSPAARLGAAAARLAAKLDQLAAGAGAAPTTTTIPGRPPPPPPDVAQHNVDAKNRRGEQRRRDLSGTEVPPGATTPPRW